MGVGRAASGWLGALVGTMGPWSLRVDLKVTFRLPEFFTTGPSDPILGKAGVAAVTQQGLRVLLPFTVLWSVVFSGKLFMHRSSGQGPGAENQQAPLLRGQHSHHDSQSLELTSSPHICFKVL